jgi:hypothetical protein
MDGGAFSLLKADRLGPETAKQAEIRLANLLKILAIAVFFGLGSLARTGSGMQ